MPTNTVLLAKWKCEICGSQGNKWISPWKAKRSYRWHVNKYHDGILVQPIMIYKKVGEKNVLQVKKRRKKGVR